MRHTSEFHTVSKNIEKWIEENGAVASYNNLGISGLPDASNFSRIFNISFLRRNSEIIFKKKYSGMLGAVIHNYVYCMGCGQQILLEHKNVRHCGKCRDELFRNDVTTYSLPEKIMKIYKRPDELI